MKKCRNVGHPDHVFAHFLARKIPFGFVVNFVFLASLCRIFCLHFPFKIAQSCPSFSVACRRCEVRNGPGLGRYIGTRRGGGEPVQGTVFGWCGGLHFQIGGKKPKALI